MAMLLASLAAACTPAEEDFGINLENLRAERSADGVEVHARQEIRLSGEARRALRHGVPLRFRIDLAVGGEGRWPGFGDGESYSYEIRYMPLSDRYQLTGPDPEAQPKTYPRLRHVLADLGDLEFMLAVVDDGPGRYEVRIRSRLDRSAMPGPMQLPVLLSPQWKHDSGWVSGNFQAGG